MKFKLTTCVLVMVCGVTTAIAQNETTENDDKTENKRPSWSAGLPERTQSANLNTPEFKPEIDNDIEMDMSEFGLKRKAEVELDLPINETIGNQRETEVVEETPEPEPIQPEFTEPTEQPPANPVTEQIAQPITEQPVEQPISQPDTEPSEQQAVQPASQPVVNNEPEPVDVETISESSEPANATEQIADMVEAEVNNDASLDTNDAATAPIEQAIASIDANDPPPSEDLAEAAARDNEYSWEILNRAPVDYPVKAAKESLEGWVEVEVTIDPSGKVIDAEAKNFSRKGRVFGNPAIQSINKWTFSPPSEFGVTENITRIYKIEFDL